MTGITVLCDAAPLQSALDSLSDLARHVPGIVQAFLYGTGQVTQLVCVDLDGRFPPGAGACRIVLGPSALFLEFLAAAREGEFDGR
jgi:hypothetical protein